MKSKLLHPIANHEELPVLERTVAILAIILGLSVFAIHLSHHSFFTIMSAVLVGIFISDAFSYLAHYALDKYEFRYLPAFASVASDFKYHHDNPGQVCSNGWM